MGLDITAYEHVRPVEEVHAIEDSDGNCCYESREYGGQNHVRIYGADFPHTLGSIIDGRCYEATGREIRFHAGSYGGYNRFREELSRAALAVPPWEVWKNYSRFLGRPFYEMINFSDCEGVIGPELSAKLARDFAEQRDIVRAKLSEKDAMYTFYADSYDQWQEAYELAADTGLVQFH